MKQFLNKNGVALISLALLVLAILITIFVPDARMLGIKEFVLGGLFSIVFWESPNLFKMLWSGLKWLYNKVA